MAVLKWGEGLRGWLCTLVFGALVCTPSSPISLLKLLLRYSAPNNDLSWLLPGRLPAPCPLPRGHCPLCSHRCLPTGRARDPGAASRCALAPAALPGTLSNPGGGGARQGGFPLLQRQRYNPTPRLLPGQWPGRQVPSSGPRSPPWLGEQPQEALALLGPPLGGQRWRVRRPPLPALPLGLGC